MLDTIFALIVRDDSYHYIGRAIWLLTIITGLSFFRSSLGRFQSTAQTLLGAKLQRFMTCRTFDKVYVNDLKYFEDPDFFDKLSRAASEAGYRPMIIVQTLLSLLQEVFVFIALFVILLAISPLLVFILLISVLPSLLMEKRVRRLVFDTYQEKTPVQRKMGYINFLHTYVSSIRELKIFRLGDYLKRAYTDEFSKSYRLDKRLAFKRVAVSLLLALMEFVSTLYAYFFALLRVIAKKASIGDFSFIVQSFSQCQGQVGQIINNVFSLYENNLFISNYFEFMEIESEIDDPPAGKKRSPVPERIEAIRFENVSFHYPGFKEMVLEDLSFTLNAGETVAMLGENGAGKSTVLKLLCRFYDPTAGTVYMNDKDIRDFDIEEYRRRIGIIFQDFTRYQFTARENIGFGNSERMADDALISSAAEATGADKFIGKLPNRYDEQLGRMFEDGKEISYGEWQKLGLARALFAEKDIVLLDEPFSHQHHSVFKPFFRYLEERREDRIHMIITHDPSVAKHTEKTIEL